MAGLWIGQPRRHERPDHFRRRQTEAERRPAKPLALPFRQFNIESMSLGHVLFYPFPRPAGNSARLFYTVRLDRANSAA